jgi:hypothetical protein
MGIAGHFVDEKMRGDRGRDGGGPAAATEHGVRGLD